MKGSGARQPDRRASTASRRKRVRSRNHSEHPGGRKRSQIEIEAWRPYLEATVAQDGADYRARFPDLGLPKDLTREVIATVVTEWAKPEGGRFGIAWEQLAACASECEVYADRIPWAAMPVSGLLRLLRMKREVDVVQALFFGPSGDLLIAQFLEAGGLEWVQSAWPVRITQREAFVRLKNFFVMSALLLAGADTSQPVPDPLQVAMGLDVIGPRVLRELHRRGSEHPGGYAVALILLLLDVSPTMPERDAALLPLIQGLGRQVWPKIPQYVRDVIAADEASMLSSRSSDFEAVAQAIDRQTLETIASRYQKLRADPGALLDAALGGKLDIAGQAIRDDVVKTVSRAPGRQSIEIRFRERTVPLDDAQPEAPEGSSPDTQTTLAALISRTAEDSRGKRLVEAARALDEDGVDVTHRALAAYLGVNERTIRRWMKELRKILDL